MDDKASPTAHPPEDERYFRRGLGLRSEVRGEVDAEWCSDFVRTFKDSGHVLTIGDTRLELAREFGFCYGVERSVDYAYETLKRFPDRRIVLTGEIIHNPRVNTRLREMGIRFFGDEDVPDVHALTEEDVVLLPAFGVAASEFERIRASGAVVVDTTCGSVLTVWKNVERYAREGLTSLVHGKVNHEETRATVSRAGLYDDGHYIVVLDLEEADEVARYIREGGDKAAFLARFPAPHTSEGFDPDRHLQRIGVANQTTMLSSESLEIARRIGAALEDRYGDTSDLARFRSFDTICSATQDRQDALRDLIERPLDLLIVIGGWNSSNTGHLAEMAEGVVPAWHVHGPDCLVSADEIHYKPVGKTEPSIDHDWLPTDGPLTIGLTAGASTPDAVIGAVCHRLLSLRGELELAAD